MMTNMQYLLDKLGEECVEVSQMCSKNKQFGVDEKQFADGESNRERLFGELNDLLAAIEMLNEEEGFGFEPDRERIDRKKAKVRHFREYSRSLGLVE